jgi:DNA-binding transcriptional regulator YdaS (Cro superfamily)
MGGSVQASLYSFCTVVPVDGAQEYLYTAFMDNSPDIAVPDYSGLKGFDALMAAKEVLGGTDTALAAVIGITQQSVNDVVRAGRPAPWRWCIPIERATGGKITRHQLRPDVYPPENEGTV